MKSMTGFAYIEEKREGLELTAELRSINQRYKDINLRVSKKLLPLENKIKTLISSSIARGKLDANVRLRMEEESSLKLSLDEHAVESLLSIQAHLKEAYGIKGELDIPSLMRTPGVIVSEEISEETDLDALWNEVEALLVTALNALEESKLTEGEALKKDFLMRLRRLRGHIEKVSNMSKELPLRHRDTLMKSLEKFECGALSEERILTEIALYADKVNITEELVRFNNHLTLFENTVALEEPIGRKLDFILQEINREANTIASKSCSGEISEVVVEIKSELEKIREQVQNIE